MSDIPILVNDTEQIVKYLNNEDNLIQKIFILGTSKK